MLCSTLTQLGRPRDDRLLKCPANLDANLGHVPLAVWLFAQIFGQGSPQATPKAPGPPVAACPFVHRQRIRLRGVADYFNPFLWVNGPDRTSGDRALREYQDGKGNDDFIYFHTRLLARDTTAVVTAACPRGNVRLLGVVITSGLHKGAFGFVDPRDAAYPPR